MRQPITISKTKIKIAKNDDLDLPRAITIACLVLDAECFRLSKGTSWFKECHSSKLLLKNLRNEIMSTNQTEIMTSDVMTSFAE